MNATAATTPATPWRIAPFQHRLAGHEFHIADEIGCRFQPGPRVGGRLELLYSAASAARLSAYRIEISLPFAPKHGAVHVHHAAFPRLKRDFAVRAADVHSVAEQPFGTHPALVFFSDRGPAFVLGPLSERQARCGFSWSFREDGSLNVQATFTLWGIDGLPLTPRTELELEEFYIEAFPDGTLLGPALLDAFNEALLRRAAERTDAGAHGRIHASPVRQSQLVWGSFTDGGGRTISHESIMAEARWIAANAPNVRWIEVGDGWAASHAPADSSPTGMSDLGVFYSKETLEDFARFPKGMAGVAAEIKALGLHPMIWLTPAVSDASALFHDKPEWFLPEANLATHPDLRFLDFSVPEAREYALRAVDLVFNTWGFQGCTLDFVSPAFEPAGVRLRNNRRSSLEWQRWLDDKLRVRIGPDALMRHGADAPQGHPFRGAAWDHVRLGADADALERAEPMEAMAIRAAYSVALNQTQRRFWIPDADGFGLFTLGDRSDNLWRLWAAFLVASGTWTELAGRLSRQGSHARMKSLMKLIPRLRLGHPVTCPGFSWSANAERAPLAWVRYDSRGKRIIGLTNWRAESTAVTLTGSMLGLDDDAISLENVLTGESIQLPHTRILPARDGELWEF